MDGKGDFSLCPPNGGLGNAKGKDETELDESTAPCVVCGIPATKTCVGCSDTISGRKPPHYCNKEHQKEDWPNHKLVCLKTLEIKYKRAYKNPVRPVDFLVRCIVDDCLPNKTSCCYKPFGFSNCKTEKEESNLLAIYVGLIKMLDTDIDVVHDAQQKEELTQLIIQEYETLRPDPNTRGCYYPWFLKNKSIVPGDELPKLTSSS